VPVQDNGREKILRELFQLEAIETPDRNPDGVADAKLGDVEFELKSASKKNVSTARDFGPDHIARYRTRQWIVGEFQNFASGAVFHRFWFIPISRLDAEWLTPLEDYFKQCALEDELILRHIEGLGLPLDTIAYRLRRGALKNDPKISIALIRRIGIEMTGDLVMQLRELIARHPLPSERQTHAEFFEFEFAA
jgi:hypothetical protein